MFDLKISKMAQEMLGSNELKLEKCEKFTSDKSSTEIVNTVSLILFSIIMKVISAFNQVGAKGITRAPVPSYKVRNNLIHLS